jgi:hypothetical protein
MFGLKLKLECAEAAAHRRAHLRLVAWKSSTNVQALWRHEAACRPRLPDRRVDGQAMAALGAYPRSSTVISSGSEETRRNDVTVTHNVRGPSARRPRDPVVPHPGRIRGEFVVNPSPAASAVLAATPRGCGGAKGTGRGGE